MKPTFGVNEFRPQDRPIFPHYLYLRLSAELAPEAGTMATGGFWKRKSSLQPLVEKCRGRALIGPAGIPRLSFVD